MSCRHLLLVRLIVCGFFSFSFARLTSVVTCSPVSSFKDVLAALHVIWYRRNFVCDVVESPAKTSEMSGIGLHVMIMIWQGMIWFTSYWKCMSKRRVNSWLTFFHCWLLTADMLTISLFYLFQNEIADGTSQTLYQNHDEGRTRLQLCNAWIHPIKMFCGTHNIHITCLKGCLETRDHRI